MSYCTQADLVAASRNSEQELIQLTDTDNTGAINTLVLGQAIARADAEINSYLLAYLPLAEIPANLVYLACDIVRYHLYADQMLDTVKARYEQAISYLKLVAANKIPIAPSVAGVIDLPVTNRVDFIVLAPDTFGKEGY